MTRSSDGTLHHQLYRTLAAMIAAGDVKPGERMPTEIELEEAYGVSRTTARRALDELRREGVVKRQSGRGTFLLHQRVDAAIPHLHSLTDEIETLGYEPGVILLSVRRTTATTEVAERLGLRAGVAVLVVVRIRTADGQPVFVGASTLNITAFPKLAEEDFSRLGMYTLFERATGLQVARSTQWLSATAATRDVARHLRVDISAPVLQLERMVYMEGDRPVETLTGFFHGGLYKQYSESRRARN